MVVSEVRRAVELAPTNKFISEVLLEFRRQLKVRGLQEEYLPPVIHGLQPVSQAASVSIPQVELQP